VKKNEPFKKKRQGSFDKNFCQELQYICIFFFFNQGQCSGLLTALVNCIFFFLSFSFLTPVTHCPISQVGHLTGLYEAIETKLHAYCILIRFLLVMIKGIWSQVVWISQSSYGIYFLERWNISSVYMVEKLRSF